MHCEDSEHLYEEETDKAAEAPSDDTDVPMPAPCAVQQLEMDVDRDHLECSSRDNEET